MPLHRRHRLPEDRGFFPPLSIASIIGIVLFGAYNGSAFFSALPKKKINSFNGVGALYSSAEEKAYCSQIQPARDECFNAPNKSNRTIYMQQYGGLGNRLRAIASALTVAREVNANVVIVWAEIEHGFKAHFDELFESPRIPLGCFPGNAIREDHAKCTIHKVNHYNDWQVAKNQFEIVTDKRTGEKKEILCMQSMMFLTAKQRGIGWFYSLLRPAKHISAAIEQFQHHVGWEERGGQWVGVHIRRTDLKLQCNTDDCSDGLSATEVIPLSKYTQILDKIASMGALSGQKPRFFLATDDEQTETQVRLALEKSANLTESDHRVVSYTKTIRDNSQNALIISQNAARNNPVGMHEAVIDLWLLSRAKMLVGTVGSSYSQTAKLIGSPFFVSVGVEYENRL